MKNAPNATLPIVFKVMRKYGKQRQRQNTSSSLQHDKIAAYQTGTVNKDPVNGTVDDVMKNLFQRRMKPP